MAFKTMVVHELTHDEYLAQRRRIIASLRRDDPRTLPGR
jgi:hypothetical protein